jgi:hypothetical protein
MIEHKGINYDIGTVMGSNWRPDYHPQTVRRELEIIKDDLHCNAVGISGKGTFPSIGGENGILRRLLQQSKRVVAEGVPCATYSHRVGAPGQVPEVHFLSNPTETG